MVCSGRDLLPVKYTRETECWNLWAKDIACVNLVFYSDITGLPLPLPDVALFILLD